MSLGSGSSGGKKGKITKSIRRIFKKTGVVWRFISDKWNEISKNWNE